MLYSVLFKLNSSNTFLIEFFTGILLFVIKSLFPPALLDSTLASVQQL
jgi:hypothetical protein